MSNLVKQEKQTWPQYVTVMIALIAMFCSGIHMGWPSPSLPKLLSDEYPFDVTSEEASYITIIAPIGSIFGNIIYSLLLDVIGRKVTILLIGLPQIICMLMIYLSIYSVIWLYIGRFIGGIAEGACYTVLPIYICEIADPKVRGRLGTSFSLILCLGVLFSNLVGSFFTIQISALVYLSCSLVFLILFSFMPESPYYLLMKNKREKAEINLKKLNNCNQVDEEIKKLTDDVNRQMSERGRYIDLWKIESNKMASYIMIILRTLQQYSGISSFTLYAQLLFRDATDAISEKYAAILMMFIQSIATFIAVLTVDKFGRKPMILTSIFGCFLTLIANAIFFVLKDLSDFDVSDFSFIPVVFLMFFVVFFAFGLGSAVNLLAGELFPVGVKSKAACLMNMVFSVGMFTSTKFYQYVTEEFSIVVPFCVFGLCQLIGFVMCLKLLPETKNKSLEEIQQELKRNK